MYYKNIRRLIFEIKKNIIQNKEHFFFYKRGFKYYEPLLSLLEKHGHIRGFNDRDLYFIIFLKYHTSTSNFISDFTTYNTSLKKNTLNRKKLLLLIKKYPSYLFIININRGYTFKGRLFTV